MTLRRMTPERIAERQEQQRREESAYIRGVWTGVAMMAFPSVMAVVGAVIAK